MKECSTWLHKDWKKLKTFAKLYQHRAVYLRWQEGYFNRWKRLALGLRTRRHSYDECGGKNVRIFRSLSSPLGIEEEEQEDNVLLISISQCDLP